MKTNKENTSMFTFTQLQVELKPWVQHNFGDRPATQPLRGITEEIGELMEALDRFAEHGDDASTEDVKDALADCMVFMADYCNGRGYSMAGLLSLDAYKPRVWAGDTSDAKELLKVLGRFNHHDLKKEQGIRKSENHDEGIMVALSHITSYLMTIAQKHGWPALAELTERTWNEVKKRDWKKNAVSGT